MAENFEARERTISNIENYLDHLGWENTVYGITTYADTSWERKANINAVLRKHPNYRADIDAIVLKAVYPRGINEREIYCFRDFIDSIAWSRTHFGEDRKYYVLEKMMDYLFRTTQFITDAYEISRINLYAQNIPELAKFKVHSGQKRTRAVKKFCQFMGYTDNDSFDRKYARYCDNINPVSVPLPTIISTNSFQFLTASTGSFTSCYNPDKSAYGGCHCSGGISHALDNSSVIMYTIKENYPEDEIDVQGKISRCMFFVSEDFKHFVQSRMYGDTSDSTREIYRSIFQKVLSDCLGVPNLWVKTNIDSNTIYNYIGKEYGATIYPDYNSVEGNKIVHCRLSGTDSEELIKIKVGAPPICVECGYEHNFDGEINCCHPWDARKCANCGATLDSEDDERYSEFHGEYGCEDCMYWCSWLEDYFFNTDPDVYVGNIDEYIPLCYLEEASDFVCCSDCGEWVFIGGCADYYENDCGEIICPSCFEENYTICADCGNMVKLEDAIEIDGEYYCEDCIVTCEHCGQVIPYADLWELDDGTILCEECHDKAIALEESSDDVA